MLHIRLLQTELLGAVSRPPLERWIISRLSLIEHIRRHLFEVPDGFLCLLNLASQIVLLDCPALSFILMASGKVIDLILEISIFLC